MAFVYILKSFRDGRFYIGSTNNIGRRFKEHLRGGTESTKRFGGLELVFTQCYKNIREARSVEMKLKKLKRHDYIEKIIKEKIIKIRS